MRPNSSQCVFVKASLVAGCLLLVSGCIPVSGTYYQPGAKSAKTIRYAGGFWCGPKSGLKLNRSGVVMWVTYSPVEKSLDKSWPEGVGIRLRVPKSKNLTFDVGGVQVIDGDGNTLSSLPVLYYFTGKLGIGLHPYELNLQETPVTLSGNKHLLQWGGSRYQIYLKLNAYTPDSFTVILPTMLVNGKHYDRVAIDFVKSHGLWLAGQVC